jgi:acyl-CoA thioesterase-1
MHPNASGVDRMVERILPDVEKAMAEKPGNS